MVWGTVTGCGNLWMRVASRVLMSDKSVLGWVDGGGGKGGRGGLGKVGKEGGGPRNDGAAVVAMGATCAWLLARVMAKASALSLRRS